MDSGVRRGVLKTIESVIDNNKRQTSWNQSLIFMLI